MNPSLAPRVSLAQRLRQPGLVVAPGVYDMVSLRLADTFGFDALYMTGFGTVASHLGLPDAGIATYTDMVQRVRTMASMARCAADRRWRHRLRRPAERRPYRARL